MGDRLEHYLSQSIKQDELGVSIKNTILSLSNASKKIAKSLAKNGLPENQLGTQVGDINSDGDIQKALDLIADENIVTALKNKNVPGAVATSNPGFERKFLTKQIRTHKRKRCFGKISIKITLGAEETFVPDSLHLERFCGEL